MHIPVAFHNFSAKILSLGLTNKVIPPLQLWVWRVVGREGVGYMDKTPFYILKHTNNLALLLLCLAFISKRTVFHNSTPAIV